MFSIFCFLNPDSLFPVSESVPGMGTMSSQIFHSSLTTDLRRKHRRLRPCSALTPPTFPAQNLSFAPLRSMSSNPYPLRKYNIPQAGGDGGDSVGHGGRSGGGGDGGDGDGVSGGDDGGFGVFRLFLNGWRSRVSADPQFPFKVLMEELVGVSSCVIGDMASRPNFGLNELDFVFSTLFMNFVRMYLLAPTAAASSIST